MRRLVPISRMTVALWLWRHRAEILGWAGFARKAATRLAAGQVDDVRAEARLRMALTADARTRDVAALDVDVRDGVATLQGTVPVGVGEAAVEVAQGQPRIRKVKDRTRRGPTRP